jgi:antitoxin VapB
MAIVYTHVYARRMARAKLFRNGGSQAVRLPKECRFPEDQKEVIVRRVGRRVILEPPDEWSEDFLGTLGALKKPLERPPAVPISKLKEPFE